METLEKCKAKIIQFFSYCVNIDVPDVDVKMIDGHTGSAVMKFPYINWILKIECLVGGISETMDDAYDICPMISDCHLYAETRKIYLGKPISAEYTISGKTISAMNVSFETALKGFENLVRKTIYDMKKAGNFNESDREESTQETPIERIPSDISDKLDTIIRLLTKIVEKE